MNRRVQLTVRLGQRFFESPENRIYSCLVTRTLRFKPFENVGIKAQRTRCATRSQHICSSQATTSAPYRSCWDTRTWGQRWSTRTCWTAAVAARSVRSIDSPPPMPTATV